MGAITGNRQALVAIDITGGEGRSRPIEVVLDTGFTGYLTLPTEPIRQLGLRFVGQRTFELARTENSSSLRRILPQCCWHGRQKDALVLKSDSTPLLGMTLLWGSRVTLNAASDGLVTIDELEDA